MRQIRGYSGNFPAVKLSLHERVCDLDDHQKQHKAIRGDDRGGPVIAFLVVTVNGARVL